MRIKTEQNEINENIVTSREYDKSNIFAKIIKGEIKAEIVYEDDLVVAFKDIAPVAPVHIIVIPKGEYSDFSDFISKASSIDVALYFQKIHAIARSLNVSDYRIISNCGKLSGQTIFHFHTHIISGKKINNLIG
ncbi:MAG: HIT domain-containing protein [Rickettsiaceae bacterium]|nr:HIT domain-containing protein [Rickettsiaceae bacterium]